MEEIQYEYKKIPGCQLCSFRGSSRWEMVSPHCNWMFCLTAWPMWTCTSETRQKQTPSVSPLLSAITVSPDEQMQKPVSLHYIYFTVHYKRGQFWRCNQKDIQPLTSLLSCLLHKCLVLKHLITREWMATISNHYIHDLSPHSCFQGHEGHRCPHPAVTVRGAGDSLDRSRVHHRVT